MGLGHTSSRLLISIWGSFHKFYSHVAHLVNSDDKNGPKVTLVNYSVNQSSLQNPTLPPYSAMMGLPGGLASKESACNAGDLCSIAVLGRYPGEGSGYPLQYSGLENSMDCIIHGVAKSQTWLSDVYFHRAMMNVHTEKYWNVLLITEGK